MKERQFESRGQVEFDAPLILEEEQKSKVATWKALWKVVKMEVEKAPNQIKKQVAINCPK